MAGCKKTRPPAPPACGLWQGFKKSGGSTGSKEHVCVSPSSIPRSASDMPPSASPIDTRPKTALATDPSALRSALRRHRPNSVSQDVGAFFGTCIMHLACAGMSRARGVLAAELQGASNPAAKRPCLSSPSDLARAQEVKMYSDACIHTRAQPRNCAHAQLRTPSCMRAVAVARSCRCSATPVRAKCNFTHTHARVVSVMLVRLSVQMRRHTRRLCVRGCVCVCVCVCSACSVCKCACACV